MINTHTHIHTHIHTGRFVSTVGNDQVLLARDVDVVGIAIWVPVVCCMICVECACVCVCVCVCVFMCV
jgi:hypothetical protein